MRNKLDLLFRASVLLALMFALALSPAARAQNAYGSIVGVISDESGAVIPGAAVTATNTATNIVHSSETNQSGDYRFLTLPPGSYDVAVEITGFKRSIQSGVVVQVNQSVRLDIGLQVGEVVETVEVIASGAAQLQTTRSTIGTVVSNTEIVELPLNGRDFTQLTLLLPGASPGSSAGGFFLIGGQTVAVTGNRSDQNITRSMASTTTRRSSSTTAFAPRSTRFKSSTSKPTSPARNTAKPPAPMSTWPSNRAPTKFTAAYLNSSATTTSTPEPSSPKRSRSFAGINTARPSEVP